MKSVGQIQDILAEELWENIENARSAGSGLMYYNEFLGNTSFVLAKLLESLLVSGDYDWDIKKWIDDLLITKVRVNGNQLMLWAVVISGVDGVTEQWTQPVYFEAKFNNTSRHFDSYLIMYSDNDRIDLSYDEFIKNRDIWDRMSYSSDDWDVSERNWRYILKS